MASQEYFRFLHLPFDVRIMILRYLLPDQHFILHEAYNADCNRGPWHRPTWLTFDYNSRSPYPDILLTNRQVYSECFYHLYTIKTFKFVLHFSHIGFAYYQFLTQKHDHLRKELQPVPYHAMKEFILEIRCPDWPTTICDFRKILIMLLRRFHVEKVHFRKLRIQFPDPLGPLPGWDHAWDNAEPKAWDFKPELVLDDDGDNVAHQELTARDSGAPSTFAWFLSAFATCPSLADECIIELPESLRDKTHMQACAKRYAEGLDGRSSFHLEDECCLKQDLYDLHHKEGYREDCSCEVCDVRTMSEWTRAVHEWLLYSIRHRSAKIRWIVRHHARGAWLSCKPRYHALNKEDGCQCGFCTCYRQHKQEERVYLEMLALTAYEKEQEAGDYEEEHDDDDDDDQQRCQRPDHLRKQLTRYGSRDGKSSWDPRERSVKTVSKSRPRNCERRDYSTTGRPTSPSQSNALYGTDYASTPVTSGRAGSRKWSHGTMITLALAAHGSIPGCHGRRVGSRLCIMTSMGYTAVTSVCGKTAGAGWAGTPCARPILPDGVFWGAWCGKPCA